MLKLKRCTITYGVAMKKLLVEDEIANHFGAHRRSWRAWEGGEKWYKYNAHIWESWKKSYINFRSKKMQYMLFPNVYIKHLQKYIQWAKKKMSHNSKYIGQSLRSQFYDNVKLIKDLQTKEKKSQTPEYFKRHSFKALQDCTWWSML